MDPINLEETDRLRELCADSVAVITYLQECMAEGRRRSCSDNRREIKNLIEELSAAAGPERIKDRLEGDDEASD